MELSLDELLPASKNERLRLDETGSETSEPNTPTAIASTANGEMIGRFRVSGLLGEGGYGRVYKAYDDQLQRHVAIKVPHLYRMSSRAAVDAYLDEARTLARLNHPGIVAVHDVGVTDQGVPYIVSALIKGTNLAARMKEAPLTLGKALQLLVEVANALGFVHSRGIVHRDIKPGNILLDAEDQPYITDFGLALRESDVGAPRTRVGTPNYMSPEQARGESHLVDGRSDIFSLGVVMYEMLTGKRPFSGANREAIVRSLLNQEARPLRQLLASVPRDLERICLKMLSKRVSDRYINTADFIEDIQHYLATCDKGNVQSLVSQSAEATEPLSEIGGVIPRGLRSYDRHDAEFFHRLLPGPRDREWVPESLRFWQRQIETTGESDPPRVGVIYGPSGCGKSSFVKAGLLPLLSNTIEAIFVEATHGDTESRLLRGIRKHCPQLNPQATLAETLSQIRDNPSLTRGRRLLIVIDQFEQWLHGHADESDVVSADPELAAALRQCDGTTIQCLLLVRDDFWLALSRFMAELEVLIEQNKNAMLVDLFSTTHARGVLLEFGIAYGRLPADRTLLTEEQNRFLDEASEQLSVAGKTFPVRLALFVEMVKGQPWTVGTLNRLGGVDGIGLQFLEESFSSNLAPAAQATHEPAVRRVLRKLLPDSGVDIKGNMQSEAVLMEASGYQNQTAPFDEMMRILDTDLRLVTPTDPAGTTTSEDSYSQSGDGVHYYQLTHDFLVPAIDQWLTRKQRTTRQGRSELRLSEYASLWATRPTANYAPSWFDWLNIQLWTSSSGWTDTEQRMMRMARRRHLYRTLGFITVLFAAVLGSWWLRQNSRATAQVNQLQTARTDQIPALLKDLRSSGHFATKQLRSALTSTEPASRPEFVCRLALAQDDRAHRDPLIRQSTKTELPLLAVLCDELHTLDSSERDFLIRILDDTKTPSSEKLRAAIVLANANLELSDNKLQGIQTHNREIVDALLKHAASAPQENSVLIKALQPMVEQIHEPLRSIALQAAASPARSLASSFLVQLLRNSPEQLLEVFLDASFEQHEAILPTLDRHLGKLINTISTIAFQEIDRNLDEPQYDLLARRSASAAALLHRCNKADATWPMLASSEWPHKRSYLVHRIGALGGDFELLLSRYSREPQVSVRRGLLFSLGEFSWDQIENATQLQAITIAKDAFKNDPDAGIHSAAHWFLMRSQQTEWVDETIDELSKLRPDPRKNWYVNREGHTMVVLDARDVSEIGYVFEIATSEVTVEQFLRFRPYHEYYAHRSPTPDSPANLTNWFHCVAYCRWLSKELNADPKNSYPEELSEGEPIVAYDNVAINGAYRLPTEAEWKHAAAALTTSRRYYGYSDTLADHYFYYYETSVNENNEILYRRAGSIKPNEFGLFSLYDGVREWGHEQAPNTGRWKVFGSSSSGAISGARTISERQPADLPNATNGFYGLRVARTVVAR